LDEYALVLQDAPVAEKVSSRVMLRSAAAESHRARVAAAQRTLAAELSKRKLQVSGAVQLVANAVFVRVPPERAAELRSLPGVLRVQYLPPVHKNLNTAADLVNATAAWNAVGGMTSAGAGIKIAIIDTGIDNTHPAFQDAALQPPAGFPKGDTAYTNGKVIVARSYVADLAGTDPAFDRPDDVTPRDRSGHGTAIAMIAAGVRNTGPLATITGIAPKAFLGNYKIFGSPGLNDTTLGSVLIRALEDAVSDGMDIATL
jgi:subtilisin family serine protease